MAKSLLSMFSGALAFVSGFALTVFTGGLNAAGIAAACAGGALASAGTAAVIHPVTKKMNGERMTGGEYVGDLLVSGIVGLATGPIGVGAARVTTSVVSKVQSTVAKLGWRAVVGAVSGATAGIIQEATAEAKFNGGNLLMSTLMGAARDSSVEFYEKLLNNWISAELWN